MVAKTGRRRRSILRTIRRVSGSSRGFLRASGSSRMAATLWSPSFPPFWSTFSMCFLDGSDVKSNKSDLCETHILRTLKGRTFHGDHSGSRADLREMRGNTRQSKTKDLAYWELHFLSGLVMQDADHLNSRFVLPRCPTSALAAEFCSDHVVVASRWRFA